MNTTDEVQILYQDLEDMHRALSGVYNYLWANDLIKAYSALRSNAQESPLTQAVKKSRDRAFGYIHEAQQEAVGEDA